MRINIGCGGFPLDGYTNIDLFPPADKIGDFRHMTFADADEVTMYHVLEHLSWRESPSIIRHVRGWLHPGGSLVVEVPDMGRIMERGVYPPDWMSWVYGVQDHPGEYHMAGFTLESLYELVAGCGFEVTASSRFISDHPVRVGFPCVSVTGVRA